MKLLEMKLSNFRQFYGEQNSIQFADGDKNITVIFGDNGDGKTGIFRGLMFGLFGTRYLAQDNANDEIHLVNMIKLKENEGLPVSSKVTVKFEHQKVIWVLEREIVGILNENQIREREQGVRLNHIDRNGNLSPDVITDNDEVTKVVSDIIDEKIKDFFLFDGEKIETLAKTNKQVKTEIKEAIIKLLQIDKLAYGLDIMKDLYAKENREIIAKSQNSDIALTQRVLDDINDKISKVQETKENHEENLFNLEMEIEDTENKLSETKPIREIQSIINELNDRKIGKELLLESNKKSLRENYFNFGHHIFMDGVYPSTRTYLNQIYVNQRDIIPIELVKKILSERVCICGTELERNERALEKIEEIASNYERTKITPLVTQINVAIDDYEKNKNNLGDNIRNALRGIYSLAEEIDEISKDISFENNKIKNLSRDEENLKQLEENLERHKKEISNLRDKITKNEIELEDLESKRNAAEKKHIRTMDEDQSIRKDKKLLNKIEELMKLFEKLFVTYSDQMRSELMKETTEIFRILIDKKDRELIQSVEINDKYEIELHNWNGTKITQDISQGQRQIVALSFITALAKIASAGRDSIDFPLFMDTPFGRMSGANRDNLIFNIPKLSSQWILLLTDTEFSDSEELAMKSTQKLGKWYRLNQIGVGHTRIEEVSLTDKMAKRR